MRTEFFWLLSLCGFAAVSLICGLVAGPQLAAVWPGIREKIDSFCRLPPLAKLVLLFFVGVFIVYGGTKPILGDLPSGTNIVEIVEGGTNDVDQVIGEGEGEQLNLLTCSAGQSEQGSNFLCSRRPSAISLRSITPLTFTSAPPPVTPEDIARGWQLVEVRTNCNIFYSMPEGAVLASNWWVRGAYEDVVSVEMVESVESVERENWRFPFGSNSYSSAWAYSWGKLRFTLGDTNEIVAVGAPMSAVPYHSRLWTAVGTNNSQLVTWENFTLGRQQLTTNNQQLITLSAQIELRSTGDFVVRSNEVESVCRRIDPFDGDGDGIPDDEDGDPWCWNGDFTGQPEGWREFVDEMVGTGLVNGYYKLTATFPSEGFRRTLLTVGWDKVVVAEPGEYVFLLEKGEDYEFYIEPFSPDVRFEVDDDIPHFASPFALTGAFGWWTDWTIDGGELVFTRPGVQQHGHCRWMPTFYGSPNVTHFGPNDDSTFVAVLDDYLYPHWASYSWSCDDDNVIIDSPYSRETSIRFHDMPSWKESSLRVETHIGTNVLVSVMNFTYGQHAEPQVCLDLITPNVVVRDGKRRKLQVEFSSDKTDDEGTLRLKCTQGREKISLWSTETGGIAVDFDKSWSCRSFEGFECYIAGTNTSESIDDVVLSLEYIPGPSAAMTAEGTVTVVDYVSEPISSIECPVLQNRPYMNPCAIRRGRSEAFWALLQPTNAPASWLSWRAKEGRASFPNGNVGQMVLVDSPSSALVLEALIYGYDDEPDPIEFKVDVVQEEE